MFSSLIFLEYNFENNFFFFFQAEDGIRDGTVTGVQTCALPIWPCRWRRRGVASRRGTSPCANRRLRESAAGPSLHLRTAAVVSTAPSLRPSAPRQLPRRVVRPT